MATSPQAQISQDLAAGRAAFANGALDEARMAFEAVLLHNPNHAESMIFLSRIAFEQGDRETCLYRLDEASKAAPDNYRIWMALADRHRHFGHTALALEAYDRAANLDPKAIAPKADKAHYLQTLGDFDTAEKLFRSLIKKHPNEAELYRIFLGGKKLKPGDPLLRQMIRLWNDRKLPDTPRMHLGFALAKALEETGARDKVFAMLNRANAIQARLHPYDRAARETEVDAFLAAQTAPFDPLGPALDPRTVFVTGMPRSGTTLVEQILSAHSSVTAAGETAHALATVAKKFATPDGPASLPSLSEAKLTDWHATYATMIRRDHAPVTPVVTDKSIQNFLIFGYLLRAMPQARIIVVHRDPHDVALSIYKNFFRLGTHRYANDLNDIAHAIGVFRRCVTHWKTLFPDQLHEVHYEDLVSDPEPQARKLIAAAGLDWEEGCLDGHKATGQIKTLSLHQARQPIHAGRRAAWRAYEQEMAPFLDAWGET